MAKRIVILLLLKIFIKDVTVNTREIFCTRRCNCVGINIYCFELPQLNEIYQSSRSDRRILHILNENDVDIFRLNKRIFNMLFDDIILPETLTPTTETTTTDIISTEIWTSKITEPTTNAKMSGELRSISQGELANRNNCSSSNECYSDECERTLNIYMILFFSLLTINTVIIISACIILIVSRISQTCHRAINQDNIEQIEMSWDPHL